MTVRSDCAHIQDPTSTDCAEWTTQSSTVCLCVVLNRSESHQDLPHSHSSSVLLELQQYPLKRNLVHEKILSSCNNRRSATTLCWLICSFPHCERDSWLTAFQRAFSASVSSTSHARSMGREDLVFGGKEEEGSDLGQIFGQYFLWHQRRS